MYRALLARSASTWSSFPPHIKYEPSVWSRHSSQDAMMLLMLRLEALYTDFILHKLVMNQDSSNRNMLIETSHLILSLVLSALNQRIALAQHRIDLEWTVSSPSRQKSSAYLLFTNFARAGSLLRHALRHCPRPRTPTPSRAATATHPNQSFDAHTRPERTDLLLRLAHGARPAELQPVQTGPVDFLAQYGSNPQWTDTGPSTSNSARRATESRLPAQASC